MSNTPSRADYVREWRDRNPEQRQKNAAYSAEWRKSNPEKVREQWKRQSERRKAKGPRVRHTATPCVRCGESDRTPSGVCRPCKRERERLFRLHNPEIARKRGAARSQRYRDRLTPERKKERNRRANIKALYGISATQYDEMLAAQGGACAICRAVPDGPPPSRHCLQIDHNHETGVVRGLLCGDCNPALGGFRDSVVFLQAAIDYLTRHKMES